MVALSSVDNKIKVLREKYPIKNTYKVTLSWFIEIQQVVKNYNKDDCSEIAYIILLNFLMNA